MANQLSKDKRKITYAEYDDVLSELERIAKAQGTTVAELMRTTAVKIANAFLKSEGKKLLPTEKERKEKQRKARK